MGGILNYTTEVTARKSFLEIQEMLSNHGVSSVLTEYDDWRRPVAISFRVRTGQGIMAAYRLAADVQGVQKALQDQAKRGQIQPRFAKPDHAERVAWRILRSKVAADLACIEIGLASVEEVMLPYMIVADGQILYRAMLEHGMETSVRQLMLSAPRNAG